MEVTQVAGVRTRARTMADETVVKNSRALKKRKLGNEKLNSRSSTFVETKTLDFEIHVIKPLQEEEPNNSCDAAARLRSPASCCSKTGSMEKPRVSDQKALNLQEENMETGTTARYYLDGNESVPKSEFRAEAETNSCRRRVLPAEKMPSEAELEEFFAAAQEGLNKRFKNKYNYDIVNDIPLKGRFEWIQVNPAGI